jgi:hypothetical protein
MALVHLLDGLHISKIRPDCFYNLILEQMRKEHKIADWWYVFPHKMPVQVEKKVH